MKLNINSLTPIETIDSNNCLFPGFIDIKSEKVRFYKNDKTIEDKGLLIKTAAHRAFELFL